MIYERQPMICDTYTTTEFCEDLGLRFGEEMPDSRLTDYSDRKIYNLREAIVLSKKLGRPLTDEEMSSFIA